MRGLIVTAVVALAAFSAAFADDKKGTEVALAGMKSTTPAEWKEETPSSSMRMAQFKLPVAEGDKEEAELALFKFPAAGTVEQNLERQRNKFLPAQGKDKIEEKKDKTKVGTFEATYQDISGTFKKKANPMAEKFTPVPGYRQLYIVFENKDATEQYYMTLLGPQKTVEKHKKAFEEWLKNFK